MLKLTVVARDGQPLGGGDEADFGDAGGTIGRAAGNDLVLPDPQRHISSSHARVYAQGGDYFLTDTSTNGVFINGSDTALGNGASAQLRNGDHLVQAIGDALRSVTPADCAGFFEGYGYTATQKPRPL